MTTATKKSEAAKTKDEDKKTTSTRKPRKGNSILPQRMLDQMEEAKTKTEKQEQKEETTKTSDGLTPEQKAFINGAPLISNTTASDEIQAQTKKKAGRKKSPVPKTRLCMDISTELLERVDKIINKTGLPRTSYFTIALEQKLRADEKEYENS